MVSEKLAAKGIRMLDAPVSGGEKGAKDASLSIMVGGPEEYFNEFKPVFEVMGKNIYHVGPISAGHAVKALNNLCSACSMIITAEAMVVATKMGLDPEKVIEVINTSTGRSGSSQVKFPNFVLTGKFNSGFSAALMNKDVDIAIRMAKELHVPMIVGSEVGQIYNYAVGKGKPGECHTAIVKYIEEWGGVEVRAKQK